MKARTMEKQKFKEGDRIGVYVCHCGLNIGRTVDCGAVAQMAARLPGVVVAKDMLYTCSDPGQESIKEDIATHGLERIVVASCSPRLHEATFRQMVREAGINPYLFEMANIREHCSWVHMDNPGAATQKAMDLTRMAVARTRALEPLESETVGLTPRTLVIGGGVAGIQAALDLADSGYEVVMVEKGPSIGGIMAALDKTFPTIDCSICILGPKMAEVGKHPHIRLLTLSEVIGLKGFVGNFEVKILKRARHVKEQSCSACGECSKVCPVVRPSEFDLGLSTRKAIYSPFPQAVPSAFTINMQECLGRDHVGCAKCVEACGKGCIDFCMPDEEIVERVGSIIVATGAQPYDPTEMDEYGYTRFENVVTSMEFERLINAGGPTRGELLRPGDRKHPRSVGFVQCVGSRSLRKGGGYCSNVCCMNTIKSTLLLKEHDPDMDVKVFYIDIRAFGKGFEELYRRSRELGVRFQRGLPGRIEELADGSLRVISENPATGSVEQCDLDLLVLAVGLQPAKSTRKIQEMLGLQLNSDGFFLEAHPKLQPVDAATRGIFFAGCAEGPKDIKDSVTQGSAAAMRAVRLMCKGEIRTEPITAQVLEAVCTACGKCAEVCPYHAITVDAKKKLKASVNTAACAGCGTCAAQCSFGAIAMHHFSDGQIIAQMDALTEEESEKKIVVFACNWCSYAGADFAGVSRLQYPSSVRLIRTMCSGRISENFLWRAFGSGAPVVLVSGCHIGDCHYINANQWTAKRVQNVRRKMEKLGIRPERLQLEWVSAAEGARFAQIMHRMEKIRKEVMSEEIFNTAETLKGISL
ncbi:MAG: CoB-CoM heterodisulfide reductase HdrA2 [Syntrophobacteraceae bacterium]